MRSALSVKEVPAISRSSFKPADLNQARQERLDADDVRATFGLTHRSKAYLYSITSVGAGEHGGGMVKPTVVSAST
jgi:hypothetical protein